ncbi:ribbon-helix-helix domain-containing protein [Catenibacterium sp. RTP21428st1_B8_RTP21428_210409]|uniref:ribbon-helix-helix domain-containing protein n=1 Tax=Catenibacterium sp. RTP21428st1_B8_RTP21428_210409 TaxID=3153689 RepID=UPI0032EF6318
MDRKEVLKTWRIDESIVKLVDNLSETLGIKKGEVIEKAIIQLAEQTSKEETLNEMKDKLDEMMNEVKIIRMYHILDTLKSSDYSNIKDVPSLTLRFDEDGRYGNKGDYVVKVGDIDKLTEYLSKTTNYYDEALSKIIKKTEKKEEPNDK